jgi:prepilin-type N-terminal cleavage/methylation domain-containing protein
MVKAIPRLNRNRSTKGERKAFTLLEVLFAAAIGVLLMAALYVAMTVQIEHAQAGREAVEQGLLVRALLRRMSNDITPSLAADPPANYSSGGGSSAGGGSPSPTSPAGSVSSPTNSTNNSSSASATSSTTPILNLQGDSERLILWVSRISSDLSSNSTTQTVTSDLRRVTYWLAGGTGAPLGLARQEVKQATSDDALITAPPDIPDEVTFVIAEEVQSVAFRYFDGTAWQTTWDGTQVNSANGTPVGPPQAVEITLSITTPGAHTQAGDNSNVKTYRHVVAIPTANGTSSASTTSTTTQQ